MNSSYSIIYPSVYINGNYIVHHNITSNTMVKRAFRCGEELISDFPDSIDLKISNKCSYGCPYCHENSTPSGKLCSIPKVKEILSQLPENTPIELAIGGGDVLDSYNDTYELIDWCNSYGFQTRITVNEKDLPRFLDKKYTPILNKIGGMGISLSSWERKNIDILNKLTDFSVNDDYKSYFRYVYRVYHIIAGLFPLEDFKKLLYSDYTSILILGYKQFGRASGTNLPESLGEFEKILKDYIKSGYEKNRVSISFDNLAIEQLHIKEFLDSDSWDTLYLGNEGEHSMYIDAVEGCYAKNSTSLKRISWDNIGLIDYFKNEINK